METTHTEDIIIKDGLSLKVSGRGIIATCPTPTNGGVFECTNNAKRIADCWNACLGIPYPSKAIAEAKDLLKECKEFFDNEATALWGMGEPQLSLQNKQQSEKIKQVLASLGEEVE